MTRDPNEWLPLYTEIIREIKLRVLVIDNLLSNKDTLGPTPRYEFCHLELRMICELIAISALVAHGDISETKSKRMRSFWEADKILSAMSKLRSDFFPLATMPVKGDDGKTTFTDHPYAIADRQEVTSLYRQCGQILHRGSLEKYEDIQTSDAQFKEVANWAAKFIALTDAHLIAAYGADGLFLWLVGIDDELLPITYRLKRLGDLPAEDTRPPAQQDTASPEKETSAGDKEA